MSFSNFMARIFGRNSAPVGLQGIPGPVGPAGPAGPVGPQGPSGMVDLDLNWTPAAPHPVNYPAPTHGHGQDAGMDLPTLNYVSIASGQRVTVDTGWAISGGLPAGTVGLVMDRSGHAANHGLTVLGGVVDPGYTGSIKVVLYNSGTDRVTFGVGDRVAQFVVLPAYTGQATSQRGQSGLGSTGTAPRPEQADTKEIPAVPARPRRKTLRVGGKYTAAEVREAYRPNQVLRDREGDYWTRVSIGWVLAPTYLQIVQARDNGNTDNEGVVLYADLPENYAPYTLVPPTAPARLEAVRKDTGEDMVNHPPHYARHSVFYGEAWDYTRHMSFSAGNTFKHAWRCMDKGNPAQDLDKAAWYANRATEGNWGTPRLSHMAIQELHAALQEYVQGDRVLVQYYLELDKDGGLDSPAPATVPLTDLAAVRRIVAAEAYTAVVFTAMGNQPRVQSALDRAKSLARHL